MIIQTIRFKSTLEKIAVVKIALQREKEMLLVPGLMQKYYVKPEPDGHYSGIFVWDSSESMLAYWESELATRFPKDYGIEGNLVIFSEEILFQLRN